MEEPNKVSPEMIRQKDLLAQLPKKKLISLPPELYKALGLDALTVMLAAVAGWFFGQFLSGKTDILYPAITMGVFLSFSLLGTLLIRNIYHRIAVIFLESLGFVAALWGAPLNALAISFGAMLLLLIWGEYASRDEIENSVEIRFFKAVHKVLGKLITALAIIAVIYYIPSWSTNKGNNFISKGAFDSIFSWSAKIAEGLYPEFQFSSTLADFSKSVARSSLQKNSSFSLMPRALQDKTLSDAGIQVLNQLSQSSGLNLVPSETVGDALYWLIGKTLLDWKSKFGGTFIGVWAIGAFLILRSFGAIFGYLVSILSFLIYHIMISLKIIRVKTENKPHEVVEFY